jgi:4-amino-4-deoxy-L-arabinose transferase-like glycosyltransferase
MSAARQAALLALLALTCFVGLGRDVWTPDEPREAEIAREMWRAPAFVPTLNGERFVEKPPLYYWTVAAAYALAGGPSPAAARAVSALASLATLALVWLWGRRAFGPAVGIAAAFGLATSAQFALSTHWIVMDALLMAFTTAALFAAHELVAGRGRRMALLAFYAAVLGALLTKGLVGPALIAAALLAYAAARRSFAVLRPVRPWLGAALVVAATGAVALAIDAEAGSGAVHDWLWVNHVARVLRPEGTGHEQPFYFYLSALPIAVFPWWAPFVAALRPSTWARGVAARDAKLFFGAAAAGMALILSAAATKRGLYLLPLLPPLLVLLAALAVEMWRARGPSAPRAWLATLALVAVAALGPVALALAYLRVLEPRALAYSALVVAALAAAAWARRRGFETRALAALGASALAAVLGLLVVVADLAAPYKDLTPFVAWIGSQVPPNEALYVLGDVDETLQGIVPFATGRRALAIDAAVLAVSAPPYVLVQSKEGEADAAALPPPYAQIGERAFGPGRHLALWARMDAPETPPLQSAAGGRDEL